MKNKMLGGTNFFYYGCLRIGRQVGPVDLGFYITLDMIGFGPLNFINAVGWGGNGQIQPAAQIMEFLGVASAEQVPVLAEPVTRDEQVMIKMDYQ